MVVRFAPKHVIVDGSNIATEGRETPSLAQLDEAVQAFIREFEPEIVTVVVDATFPNRIARDERQVFEEAIAAGEVITPPAGAIGRGDAFVLQIADRAEATVLSNDSFQEFHGTYPWLFDEGRLIGGKPVPHVGWVFMVRTPVRGPASRRAVSAARRTQPTPAPAPTPAAPEETSARRRTRSRKAEPAEATAVPEPTPDHGETEASEGTRSRRRTRSRKAAAPGSENPALPNLPPKPGVDHGLRGQVRGVSEAGEPTADGGGTGAAEATRSRRRTRSRRAEPAEAAAVPEVTAVSEPEAGSGVAEVGEVAVPPAYNEALPFIEFVGDHPVGSGVDAVVEHFGSHGAYLRVGDVRAYAPLKNLADPAPRSAREVLRVGESRRFVVASIDPGRRGVDLAIPGVVPLPEPPPAKKATKAKKPAKKAVARKKAAG